MSRMSIEERRVQVVDAALAVAARDGLERTTVRAIAQEAQVSLGVLHYCFTDKAEIMLAVARRLTEGTLAVVLEAVDAEGDDWIERVVESYSSLLAASADRQLLSIEITVASLRDPGLSGVAAEQRAARLATMELFVAQVGYRVGASWDAEEVTELAGEMLCQLDGITLTWLVSRDDEALRAGLRGVCQGLTGRAVGVASS